MIRLSRQAAVLHQNSSGPSIHFRSRLLVSVRTRGKHVHALYFRLFFRRGLFLNSNALSISFSSYDDVQLSTRFGQVYIYYISTSIVTPASGKVGKLLKVFRINPVFHFILRRCTIFHKIWTGKLGKSRINLPFILFYFILLQRYTFSTRFEQIHVYINYEFYLINSLYFIFLQ